MNMETSAKGNVVLTATTNSGIEVTLRTATTPDLHLLRLWKNANREYFFYHDEITPAQQVAWFESYQLRPLDFMFIVRVHEKAIGCMGMRLVESTWDVYNIILGDIAYGKQGMMGAAFQHMLTYAHTLKQIPITVKVLKRNPAVGWYQKQDFFITSESADYFSMNYQSKQSNEEAP